MLTKASNGFWHSFFFTTGGYEDNIQIKPHSREITEKPCRNCHGEIVDAIEAGTADARRTTRLPGLPQLGGTSLVDETNHGAELFEEDLWLRPSMHDGFADGAAAVF